MSAVCRKVAVHSVICLFILLVNYGFSRLFSTSHIPFRDIFFLSLIYMVFYVVLGEAFAFIWSKPLVVKVVLSGLYIVLAWNIVSIIDAAIYRLLPAMGTVLYDESKPQNLQEYHYRIWRGFIIVNALSVLYVVLLAWYRQKRANIEMDGDLQRYRARVVDAEYTSHFLKSIFQSTFGKMLLDDAPKERDTKMDIIEFLGYLFTIEKLGAMDDWLLSKDKLDCFVRLLKQHYGKQAVVFTDDQDGTLPKELPRGILLFPLENCLKHSLISPDTPVRLHLQVCGGRIELSCVSRIDHLKIKGASGQGYLHLQRMVRDSKYNLQLDPQTQGDLYSLHLVLTPLTYGKA